MAEFARIRALPKASARMEAYRKLANECGYSLETVHKWGKEFVEQKDTTRHDEINEIR